MAYVPSNGRVYTFGLGGSGQLGTGSTTNRLSPSVVRGPFVPHEGNIPSGSLDDNQAPFVINKMYAGGDQCFVTVTEPKVGTQVLVVLHGRVHCIDVL